jgi:hypothetical protein
MARAKKQPKQYTVADLQAIKERLIVHRAELVGKLRGCPLAPTFDESVRLRDAAQNLTTTCHILDSIIDTCIELAQHRGSVDSVPYLEECGLELEPANA